ncbi:MAG: alpha/beta hydrolase family protein [Anaerolineae bacterium]
MGWWLQSDSCPPQRTELGDSCLGEIPCANRRPVSDESVPAEFSQTLYAQVLAAGRYAELYLYEGDNHNLSNSFSLAMRRTIQFFDTYVKGAGR